LPRDESLFRAAELELYGAVDELGDVIPSILVAGEDATDQAVATPVIYLVMNRRIARPFTVGIGMTDFELHIVAMLAFRQAMLDQTSNRDIFNRFPWMNLTSVIF